MELGTMYYELGIMYYDQTPISQVQDKDQLPDLIQSICDNSKIFTHFQEGYGI